ncbi:phosphopentomutase [Desulfofundulus thermocisternus]|uniref:phosphopentomutase n=1 Tax=Desulfofundulus thermocisternus TaxID=42471 RepID=UPI00217CC8D8|nr:phosphopentomutase [Desulfofundulus thermocisternus]MCS5694751.1 phosphopentomutase [Desulfofundulus thermocisternus]
MQAVINRLTLIVLDSVGIGELPDAERYGDRGSNTLANTARAVGGLNLPNLGRLGLGNILAIEGVPPVEQPLGAYGRMAEASAGKDTTTGHWEIAGLLLERPFPVYPHGFPPEIIESFEKRIGRPVLGNRAASGTAIIEELGEEHIKTGYPIVYTSADSVFQIAAHEEVIPVNELYGMCRVARELLTGPHAVGRVIARPFVGKPGAFKRTDRRRDFSLPPPAPTVLDLLTQNGFSVLAVGKIEDIFAGRGITEAIHTKDNMDGVDRTVACMRRLERGLIFTNLVDFDMLYGHRNNPRGYAAALEAFDRRLPEILSAVSPDEVLIITADHGCDPTTSSTDHSREYVPLLVYGPLVEPGVNLGTRSTFSDVAASVAEFFGLSYPRGTSFVREVVIR